MGSFCSTRWGWHSKRTVVEDCRVIDLAGLARHGAFVPWYSGTLRWFRGEKEVASIGYNVRPREPEGLVLCLSYRISTTREDVEVPIRLETTPLHFGGCRWWGRCPLQRDGIECGRRVGKLYLPPGSRYFGCRHCHDLTYTSVQEHDKRVDALRRNPEALDHLLGNLERISTRDLILALKATRRRC
jgi:hypothetical protein